MSEAIPIKGLHHSAFRCRDSEETREFYEDFLGLPLADAMWLGMTKTERSETLLHTFFRLADGSFIAFFEVPGVPFEFIDQHDFDLHIALEVEPEYLLFMRDRAREAGIECRGPSDHHICESIYLRDPNGYVIELAVKTSQHDQAMNPGTNGARGKLNAWIAAKNATTT